MVKGEEGVATGEEGGVVKGEEGVATGEERMWLQWRGVVKGGVATGEEGVVATGWVQGRREPKLRVMTGQLTRLTMCI